jgi:hypothetical protein
MEPVRVDEHSGLAVEEVTNGSAFEREQFNRVSPYATSVTPKRTIRSIQTLSGPDGTALVVMRSDE